MLSVHVQEVAQHVAHGPLHGQIAQVFRGQGPVADDRGIFIDTADADNSHGGKRHHFRDLPDRRLIADRFHHLLCGQHKRRRSQVKARVEHIGESVRQVIIHPAGQ